MQRFEYMDRHRISERKTDEGFAVISHLGRGETCAYSRTISVKLVLDGEEAFRIGQRLIRVPAGAMMVVEANEPVIGTVRDSATAMCISLPRTYQKKLGRDLDAEKEHGVLLHMKDSAIGRFLDRTAREAATLFREGGQPQPIGANFRRRLHTSLPDLLQNHALNLKKTGAGSVRASRARLQQVNYARSFLSEGRRRDLALANVAAAAGMSQHALSLHFTNVFGETPMNFHNRLRLDAAFCDLTLGFSAAETARRTGFQSLERFRASFQQSYSVLPETICASASAQ